ncbi:MAG: hypothetical protein QM790_11330 [Nibricoccus sp.]
MRSSVTKGGIVGLATAVIGSIILSAPPAAGAASSGDTFRMEPSFSTVIESSTDPIDILVVKPSPDGGFFAGGNFSTIGGQMHLGLAKLKADGSIDANFNRNGGFNGPVDCIEVLSDGRLLIAGLFNSFNGIPRPGLARLNVDGTLDATFVPDRSVDSPVKLAVQSDGRILLVGRLRFFTSVSWFRDFTHSSATSASAIEPATLLSLSRINADGSADPSFTPPSVSTDGYLVSAVLQPDGKIIIGGTFSLLDNTAFDHLARLNPDGSVDKTFKASFGSEFALASLGLQTDGKVLVLGLSNSSGWMFVDKYFVRLNPNGSPDTTFHPNLDLGFTPTALLLQTDGKILLGGALSYLDYTKPMPSTVARLNSDGSIDTTFSPASLGGLQVTTFAVQTDGHIAVGGYAGTTNSLALPSLARLSPTGTADSLATTDSRSPATQLTAIPLTGGKFLVGGHFNWVNGISRNGIARLNADGSLDPSFEPGRGFDGAVECLVMQNDGRILAGGSFSSFDTVARDLVVRLNNNGTLDASFNADSRINGITLALAPQSDGSIIAGGTFSAGAVVRFGAGGMLDSNFTAPFESPAVVYALAAQPDGKILVGGELEYLLPSDFSKHSNIARLSGNGSIDATFNPGAGADNIVNKISVQSNGQVLLGGWFSNYNATARSGLARIQPGGALDASFSPATQFGLTLTPAIQTDGRLVLGSLIAPSGLVRLNTNGSADTSFSVLDRSGQATSASFTSDGHLLAAGGMAFNGTVKQIGLTLLKPDQTTPTNPNPPPAETPQSSPASGGGGAPSVWLLCVMSAMLATRRLTRARGGV